MLLNDVYIKKKITWKNFQYSIWHFSLKSSHPFDPNTSILIFKNEKSRALKS